MLIDDLGYELRWGERSLLSKLFKKAVQGGDASASLRPTPRLTPADYARLSEKDYIDHHMRPLPSGISYIYLVRLDQQFKKVGRGCGCG